MKRLHPWAVIRRALPGQAPSWASWLDEKHWIVSTHKTEHSARLRAAETGADIVKRLSNKERS